MRITDLYIKKKLKNDAPIGKWKIRYVHVHSLDTIPQHERRTDRQKLSTC